MEKSCIFLLLLHVFMPCTAYYASSIIKTDAKSLNVFAGLKQAAQILNVPEPGRILYNLSLCSFIICYLL